MNVLVMDIWILKFFLDHYLKDFCGHECLNWFVTNWL